MLFPVAILCCILQFVTMSAMNNEVLLIKLSIVEYNCGYCKKYC